MVRAATLILALALAASAQAATQEFGTGDVVYRRELKEPLPNAFGGRDIWGRKRTVGLIELRFLGLNGEDAIFARRDTRIMTNETTMNRSGMVMGQIGDSSVFLSGVGPGPTIQAMRPDELQVRVNVAKDPILLIDGMELRILSASESRVTIDVPTPKKR